MQVGGLVPALRQSHYRHTIALKQSDRIQRVIPIWRKYNSRANKAVTSENVLHTISTIFTQIIVEYTQ
jgi:hypothetical protein